MAHEEYTVMVVDDEPSAHAVLEPHLRDQFRTISAYNATQALALAQSTRIDAIVLDIGLPEGVGYQFIPQLRANGAQVLVHTAYPSLAVAGHSYALGARHILEKSIEIAIILPA